MGEKLRVMEVKVRRSIELPTPRTMPPVGGLYLVEVAEANSSTLELNVLNC
jgi:hypothetical protein